MNYLQYKSYSYLVNEIYTLTTIGGCKSSLNMSEQIWIICIESSSSSTDSESNSKCHSISSFAFMAISTVGVVVPLVLLHVIGPL